MSLNGLLPVPGPAAMALDCDVNIHAYDIHVYTGFRSHAQTRSNVSLRIRGTGGCSQILHLHNDDKKVRSEAIQSTASVPLTCNQGAESI